MNKIGILYGIGFGIGIGLLLDWLMGFFFFRELGYKWYVFSAIIGLPVGMMIAAAAHDQDY